MTQSRSFGDYCFTLLFFYSSFGKQLAMSSLFLFILLVAQTKSHCNSSNLPQIQYEALLTFNRIVSNKGKVINLDQEANFINAATNSSILCCQSFNITHQVLDLYLGNQIEEIEDTCFSKAVMNVTTSINLSSNKLTVVRSGTFKNLILVSIVLTLNHIEWLEDEAFTNLPNLTSIILTSNKLKIFNKNSFKNVPSLVMLALEFNHIKMIGSQNFYFLEATNLIRIYLSVNEIEKIDDKAFSGFSNKAIHLGLSGNQIASLNACVYHGHHFTEIDVRENKIRNFFGNCGNDSYTFIDTMAIDEYSIEMQKWAEQNNVSLVGTSGTSIKFAAYYFLVFVLLQYLVLKIV